MLCRLLKGTVTYLSDLLALEKVKCVLDINVYWKNKRKNNEYSCIMYVRYVLTSNYIILAVVLDTMNIRIN